MSTKAMVVFIVSAVAIASVAVFLATRNAAASPAGRLDKLLAQRPDFLIFIGVPVATPTEWAPATRQREGFLEVRGHGILKVSDVRAFVVAYPSGQMLDAEPCGLPLPASLNGLSPATQAE